MAKELFNSDFYTLPEQVQINKEDIETNTTDIAKLKDDIGKIKPDAWEERKFKVNLGTAVDESGNNIIDFTTYNPITNQSNPIVNIQRAFTDKDTYALTDAINSYSFTASSLGIFAYLVCGDPSLTLNELFGLEESSKNYMVLANTDVSGDGYYWLLINCRSIDTFSLVTSSLAFGRNDTSPYIDAISTADDKREHSVLTAKAVDQYYLKKTDASNTYLTKTDASNTYLSKTDASNTYVTKQDYDERYDTGDISLTQDGYDKINSMAEDIGTTITLTDTSDFTENTQVSNTCELILSVYYNANPIYRNIHLMPNQTIDDYTAYQDATEENWYTGHAILVLSSQDYGYFAITYQNGTPSQLILTLIALY